MKYSEDKYRLLIENLPDPYVYSEIAFDERGNPAGIIILAVNSPFLKMVEKSREEIIGSSITAILAGIEKSSFDWISTFTDVAVNGGNICFLGYLEPVKRWFEVTAFSDKTGCFSAILRDHTAIVEAEQKYHREQHEKNIILNHLNEQVAYLDLDMRIIWANPKVEERHKIKPEDYLGHRCYEVYHQFSEPCSDCPVVEAIRTGKICSGLHHSPDDQYWQVTGNPIYNSAGKMTGVIETALNITDLIKAEETLRISEERFRLTAELAPVGIIISDDQENNLFQNKKFYELFGYTKDEIKSVRDWWPLAYPDPQLRKRVRHEWEKAVKKAIQSGSETTPAEFPVTCKDGTIRHIEFRFASRGDLNVVIFSDVTERRLTFDKIRYISFHDSLTGLYNRAYLEEEMSRLDTVRQLPLSIIMADLNGLKLVNDTYGHATGDELLQKTAEIINKSCRKEDIIARWGGDEYVVLLPQTSREEAGDICKRISRASTEARVADLPISMALGFASKTGREGSLIDTLREAEDEMYKQKLTESRSMKSAVLSALLKALAEKSYETEVHTRGMQEMALIVGKKLALSDSELHRLNLLIVLHDIGKINIAEEILTKKESLTEEEWQSIKKHPETGYRIALATGDFAHVADEILSHHERWDGKGYPRGLAGRNIPLLARIAAVVDAYEVMSNGRPYKKALSRNEIIAELKSCAGSQFDPEIVTILLDLLCANPVF